MPGIAMPHWGHFPSLIASSVTVYPMRFMRSFPQFGQFVFSPMCWGTLPI